jgi:hypothetical protein
MPARPHDVFTDALEAAGWTIIDIQRESVTSANPTRLSLRRGRRRIPLLVYAWNISDEGEGRQKAGRQDRDYRIQTTVPKKGKIELPNGYTWVGLGWDGERGVFAAFDPWVKRHARWSSSVHIHRSLLERAATEGWAEELRDDGPEAAFVPTRVDDLLSWLGRIGAPRTAKIMPAETTQIDDDTVVVLANTQRRNPLATWMRVGDSFVLHDGGRLLDWHVWRITAIEPEWEPTGSKRERLRLRYHATRLGIINDDSWLEPST